MTFGRRGSKDGCDPQFTASQTTGSRPIRFGPAPLPFLRGTARRTPGAGLPNLRWIAVEQAERKVRMTDSTPCSVILKAELELLESEVGDCVAATLSIDDEVQEVLIIPVESE